MAKNNRHVVGSLAHDLGTFALQIGCEGAASAFNKIELAAEKKMVFGTLEHVWRIYKAVREMMVEWAREARAH